MKTRIQSIDLLRGLVMVIMAIDHTRDMFHSAAFLYDPLDLGKTYPILFFTRWITHFCAPVFVFLAGTSIFMQGLRKTKSELSLFLFKRGIWLVFIELAVITLAITFDIHYHVFILQVIWAIGISMILLALFIRLPYYWILAIGLVIVLGHNLLDFIEAGHTGTFGFWWDLLHRGHFARYAITPGHRLVILYPFLPWTGVMLLGYCFGKLYEPVIDALRRKQILLWMGTGVILFFILLRASNLYGDPVHWSVQKNGLYTFLSFINTYKYPPSLLYLCMTLGPALLFLAWTESVSNFITKILVVYGRVPFLYYVLHFYLLHFIRAIFFLAEGHSFNEGMQGVSGYPFHFFLPGEGYHLWVVYTVWLIVVIALYPVCKRFSDYKMNHKEWWLSYL